jgi:phosphoribosyl 1,2-cyclic phosphate phosphodiesterase
MSGRWVFTILGCGSSGGVPRGDGDWGDCDPGNPRNRRRRCSLLVQRYGAGETPTSILIDTSPDLREQMLDARVRHLDAVLYTHDHADQAHGIDDLRVFAMRTRRRIPCWMDAPTRATLESRFRYIFEPVEGYLAICDLHDLPPLGTPFSIDGPGGPVEIMTFDQLHGPIHSVGYRIGPVAYSPDVSDLDDAALAEVARADTGIVDALRWTPHPTHTPVDKTLGWIARSGGKAAVLTNMLLDLDYAALKAVAPPNVDVAWDGLALTFAA